MYVIAKLMHRTTGPGLGSGDTTNFTSQEKIGDFAHSWMGCGCQPIPVTNQGDPRNKSFSRVDQPPTTPFQERICWRYLPDRRPIGLCEGILLLNMAKYGVIL